MAKIIKGSAVYVKGTADGIINALEEARRRGQYVRIYFGDKLTGEIDRPARIGWAGRVGIDEIIGTPTIKGLAFDTANVVRITAYDERRRTFFDIYTHPLLHAAEDWRDGF
jgi:hypothetical protein